MVALVENKIVNCAELSRILENRFGNITHYDNKDELEQDIDNFITEHVELVAWNELDKDENSKYLINEIIDNVDEFRDTQHKFCNDLADKLGF